MAAPVKISRALSVMLLRDLPVYIARAAAAGIPGPKLSLEYADGLTRTDAMALQAWAGRIPAVRAALGNLAHPDNGAVRAFAALTQHFAAVHPQADNGEPAPWNEPLSVGMRAVLNGQDIPGELLPPGEAQALLAYHATRADLVAAHRDKSDPLHDRVMSEIAALSERAVLPAEIAPAPPADAATAQKDAATMDNPIGDLATLQARIGDINTQLRTYRLGAQDRALLLDELGELLAALPPGTKPAPAAPGKIVADTERPVAVVVEHGPVSRPGAVALTDKLKDPNLRGQARQDVLAELETALAQEHAPAPVAA